jgi:N4-(beta-N-acetylglucosaminyl)-L-asparaginase
LYVDQDIGAAGSTGRGEENIRIAGAHSIVENMRHGMGPKEACLDALKRVARNFNNNKSKLAQFDLFFYALRKDGAYAGASLWSARFKEGKLTPTQFSVNDGGQSRHELCSFLLERKP